MSFDKKLKTMRLENKMTQEYVASRLYETKNRQPSHEKLASIASLFHVTIDYLLDDTDSIELNPSQGIIYSDAEKELVLRYRKLSSQSRRELLSYMSLLELRDSKS